MDFVAASQSLPFNEGEMGSLQQSILRQITHSFDGSFEATIGRQIKAFEQEKVKDAKIFRKKSRSVKKVSPDLSVNLLLNASHRREARPVRSIPRSFLKSHVRRSKEEVTLRKDLSVRGFGQSKIPTRHSRKKTSVYR